jgi:putative Holliday junction resolvase
VTRWLGIDLGAKRVGLAVADGDPADALARPLATLQRGRSIDDDAARLRTVLDRERIEVIIVGLPLDVSGDEGPQAALTRAWGEALAAKSGLPVAFRDERLTSHLAEARLGPMKRGRSGGPPTRTQRDAYRARVDREAAAIILQDELDTRAGRRSSTGGTQDPQESST